LAIDNGNIISAEDLRPVLKYLSKAWIFILLFPIIGFLAGYLHTRGLKDIYASKTELLLKSNETYDYQTEINRSFGYINQYQDIENQKRIIKSYDLIYKTVQKLKPNISYYSKSLLRTDPVDRFPHCNVAADWKKLDPSLLGIPITTFFKVIKAWSVGSEVPFRLTRSNLQAS